MSRFPERTVLADLRPECDFAVATEDFEGDDELAGVNVATYFVSTVYPGQKVRCVRTDIERPVALGFTQPRLQRVVHLCPLRGECPQSEVPTIGDVYYESVSE